MNKVKQDIQNVFIPPTHTDVWEKLKDFTDARIALGRAGCSIPSKPMLDFQLSHAQARDAVFQTLDTHQLIQKFANQNLKALTVQSQAMNKEIFLKRPDLGRLLNKESQHQLKQYRHQDTNNYDVCIVIGDGLSARAINENAFKMTLSLQQHFISLNWKLAPIIIATGSRVALGDQIVELLNIPMVIMMIGERPGLSSPDSMGIYYTWNAKTGSLDSSRNCISNIRPAGLDIPIATQRLIALMKQSRQMQISGVHLKDEHQTASVKLQHQHKLLF